MKGNNNRALVGYFLTEEKEAQSHLYISIWNERSAIMFLGIQTINIFSNKSN